MLRRILAPVLAVMIVASALATLPSQAAPTLTQEAATDNATLQVAPTPTGELTFQKLATYTDPEGVSEIVDFDPATNSMFTTNADAGIIDIINISDARNPTRVTTIPATALGNGTPNSVAVKDGIVAVAVAAPNEQDLGDVYFFNTDGTARTPASVEVGALPDMLTFTPDGSKIVVANEGEPNDDYTVDPEGSVSIITVSDFSVVTVGFTDFNVGGPRHAELYNAGARINGGTVRVFGNDGNQTVAQDVEPEYIAVSDDSSLAYVMLQENNAVAIINLSNNSVVAIIGQGFKDHNAPNNPLDVSDEDSAINIANYNVLGMYQSDAIDYFMAGGQGYVVTANEGDARDYDGFSEEVRVGDLTLDPTQYPADQATALERLRVTNAIVGYDANGTPISGDSGDGTFEQLYSYGARSFSIWNGTTGELVFDSGSQFGEIAARDVPDFFNANYSTNTNSFTFDARSDDKGTEPEGVTVGTIGENIYAFIGLERQGGVMAYNISNPATPEFVGYVFDVDFAAGTGDISPEGIKFVDAADSPTGNALLLVSHEISGTVAIWEITEPTAYLPIIGTSGDVLTLLHNNDGESTILPLSNSVNGTDLQVSSVAAYKSVLDREIADARAQGNSVLNVYAGDAYLASATLQLTLNGAPFYDAIAQNQMPYDVHVIGNHEFDYNPDFLEQFIRAFNDGGDPTQPFLGANLDFSGEPGYASLVTEDADGIIDTPVTNGRVVGNAAIITDEETGKQHAVIGLSPLNLVTISSPRNVQITANDVAEAATLVNNLVNQIEARGVNRIILVSHLQDIGTDQQLATQLSGIDLLVGGGGDELLANPNVSTDVQLLPGDDPEDVEGEYPLQLTDADGETVYLVTTAGNYRYVGRLDAIFGQDGEVYGFNSGSSFPRRVIPDTAENAAAIAALGVTDAVTPDANIVTTVQEPVAQGLQDLSTPIIGTEVVLNTARGSSTVPGQRSAETNTGNLVTDAYIWNYDRAAEANAQPARNEGNRIIAIQNGGGIRQNAGDVLPSDQQVPGTISRLDTFNVLAFFNTMSIVQDVTPTEMKEIFERSASRIGGGQFLQVAGVRVEYDLSQPAQVIDNDGNITTPGSRVQKIELTDASGGSTVAVVENGQVVAGAPTVDIVTNAFTAGGGDNYVTLASKPSVQLLTPDNQILTYEDAWVRYMRSFPAGGSANLPTIPNESRYQNNVNERIIITGN